MDIALISKMVRELIVENDSVALPGIGSFVAVEMPAVFSDRGYTINPPYRKLNFVPGDASDRLLAKAYAKSNNVDVESAEVIINHFLQDVRNVLLESKSVAMPCLGKLRATKGNTIFFVADQDLDIYPEGYGLKPVSLRNHQVVAYDMPLIPITKVEFIPDEPRPVAQPEVAEVPSELVAAEPPVEVAPEPEPVVEEPEPTPEPAEEPATEPEPTPEPAEEPVAKPDPTPAEPATETPARASKKSRWWIAPVVLIALAAVALGVFVLLAHIVPDFIDSILYTPEELRIINS